MWGKGWVWRRKEGMMGVEGGIGNGMERDGKWGDRDGLVKRDRGKYDCKGNFLGMVLKG
jgi:hypothetical protein